MKTILLLLILALSSTSLGAQIGTTVSFQTMETSTWNRMLRGGYSLEEVNLFRPTTYLGLDFQLPFPRKGVRLTTEFSYSIYSVNISYERSFADDIGNVQFLQLEDDYRASFYGLSLNGDFYLFNFANPTNQKKISEQHKVFQDGFFFRVAPTCYYIRYNNHNLTLDPLSSIASGGYTHIGWNFSVRVAAGIDLIINNFLTVSPIISYTFLNELSWYELGVQRFDRSPWGNPYPRGAFLSDAHHFQLGVRLGVALKPKPNN